MIIPKSSSPVRNYKDNGNDRLDLSREHDTAGENLALVVRLDHQLAIVLFQCFVLNLFVYMDQVPSIAFIWVKLVHQLRNIFYWCGSFIRLIRGTISSLHRSNLTMVVYLSLILQVSSDQKYIRL